MSPLLSKSPAERRSYTHEIYDLESHAQWSDTPLPREVRANNRLSLARRDHDVPGLIINPQTHMAWRPYENLIDGELDNRTPGKVTGWIRFFRSGKRPLRVRLGLTGDFHRDIRGRVIRLSNPNPTDRNAGLDREGTYVEGLASMQRGEAGDITAGLSLGEWTEDLAQKLLAEQELQWDQAGIPASERAARRQELAAAHRECIEKHELFYPYVPYPYIEWYSEANGRVVLELDPTQVEIVGGPVPPWHRTEEIPLFEERSLRVVAKALESAGFERLRKSRRSDLTTNA